MKSFSPALDHLLNMRKEIAERTTTLEGEVKVAERDYAGRLRELDGGFEVSHDLSGATPQS